MPYLSHNILKKDDAEVGTSSLILFITMIIIATVAFSSLMASTSVLQKSVDIAAKESKQRVSSAIYIDEVVGFRSKNNDTSELSASIQRIDLYLSLSASSQPIDMSQTKFLVRSKSNSAIFGYDVTGGQTKADSVYFIMEAIADTDDSMNATVPSMSYGDIVRIVISTADNSYCADALADVDLCSPTGLRVQPYDDVSITVIPEKGIENSVSFNVPSTMGSFQYIIFKEE